MTMAIYLSYLTGCGTWPFGSQIGSMVFDSVACVVTMFSDQCDSNRDEYWLYVRRVGRIDDKKNV